MTDATLITDEQVATINEARTALAKIAKAAHHDHDSQASGMVYAQASAAEDALFRLLVWFDVHADGGLSKAQFHNEQADAA
jgi:hypothetical protein